MGFPLNEREQMLNLKGVGETVILRLEQLGYCALSQLAQQDTLVITKQISLMIGSTCWHNSPQARQAIESIIQFANKKI